MATAAAAMAARAYREVERLFFDNNAFSPERAVGFDLHLPIQQRYLERLISDHVVHEAEPGRYWLDLPKYKGAAADAPFVEVADLGRGRSRGRRHPGSPVGLAPRLKAIVATFLRQAYWAGKETRHGL